MKKPSLNHSYRLIWSRVQEAFVVVAEHVKSHGKSRKAAQENLTRVATLQTISRFAFAKKALLSLVVTSALLSANQNTYAQWTDLVIESGSATSTLTGNHLNLNVTSGRVIGAASSLDIAANESVNVFFTQGGGQGLFRSTGNAATSIMGGLNSNGNLFLINENGVLFGQGAQVDVGGLVASTMNISNASFLNGHYQFNANGNNGSVNNQGVIKVSDGGYLVLLGKEVKNSGTLTANNGSVVMASADTAVLDFYGNGLVKANLSGNALEAVVTQAGRVQADGGSVQLATNSRSSAVNVSGLIQANTLVERNGVIRLEGGNHAKVAVSGTLKATGQAANTTGGRIEVTGEQVALFDGANIDASGDAAGGTVLIGGDYQGSNPTVYNARTTYVDQNASINVSAYTSGDAGKAIVWADQITRYYGSIEAKGGAQSGNGGFVEVSGKQHLDFIGSVDVSAANGKGGTVLLDPEFIVLNNSTQTAPANNPDGTPDLAYGDAPIVGTTTIQISDVRGFSELFLQATKDITVANSLYMQTNNSIVFEAGRDINVNAAIRTYGTGSTSLTAANDINVNGEVRTYNTGDIDFTAGNHLNINANVSSYDSGSIFLRADSDGSGAGDLTFNKRIFNRHGEITLTGHNIVSTTTAGYIQTQGLVGQSSGSVYLNAGNNVDLSGHIITYGRNGSAGVDGAGAGIVDITAAGSISTKNISSYGGRGGTGNTNGGSGGTIFINSTGTSDVNTGVLNARAGAARGTGSSGLSGNIDLDNNDGAITTSHLYVHGNTNGRAGNIDINANGDVTTNRIYAQGGGVATGNTAIGNNGGNVNVTAVNININDTVSVSGTTGRGLDQAGGNAGDVNLSASGAINTKVISANGGNATNSNADGGNAGIVTIQSTGVGNISTGTLSARNGAARGDGDGGLQGAINISNTNGDIATKNLYTHGNTSGDAGNISLAATSGDIAVTGNVYAHGGRTATGSTASGTNGGNVDINAANGDVAVTGRIYTLGGSIGSGNTAAGGDGGNVTVTGSNLNFNNVIYAYGNSGRGLHQVGGDAGNINLNATGAISAKNIYAYGGHGGTGTGSHADGGNAGTITINSTGAGDITTDTVNARNGAARGNGLGGNTGSINISNTSGDIATKNLDTYGNLNGHGGDINVSASAGDVTVTGRVYSYGGTVNNGHTLAGRNGGNINISGANTTITSRVNASGNTAKGTNQAGGDAGAVNITASNALTVRDVYSRNGRATDAGAGGSVGSITLNGGSVTATSTISTSGERNGDAGNINIASTSGDINVKNVYAGGGGANTNTTGNNAGNITLNSAGAITTSNVSANGSAGNGINQDGGNAGAIDIDAVGAITANAVSASGGTGGNGAGSHSNGGNAGSIDVRSTAAGDININNSLSMHSGFARGSGNGGDTGSITIKNDAGNINTKNIYAEGYNHGDGSDVTLDAAGAGNVTVTGQIRVYGDVNATGDRTGSSGGDVVIKGINTTVTSTINANGYRARGTDQSGGDAGTVAVTATGDVSLQNVYARNGNATGAGAGGNVGSINVTGGTITTANLFTSGERNGDGGNINLTSTTGDIATTGLYVQGGGANTNTAGNNAGNITVNSAGAFSATNHLYALGSSGNGANNNGGNAGAINVTAAGAINAARVYAYGGTGGGNNAITNTAAGGNAGNVTLNSTAAGGITLTQDVNVRTGYSRGSAPGATAGNINITNADGNINTRNIRAEGQNHGNGSDVTIDAGTTGDVTVNGVIYTFGDVNPTAPTFVGTNAGNINIQAKNVAVTNAINTNGGRGRGANQVGGDAGDVTINAAGAISTQAIAANGGNAGSGAGSNAAGGDAGDVNLVSTGAGDITTTTISARTGYTRGTATATGAGSVSIRNDDGALTTGNITTRGQRRGVGGDITAVTTGGDITVGIVDARASNIAASNGGDVTLATTTGDATVPNILTGGRWLVYSGDPRNDTIGAFKSSADFKQYNTNYGDALLNPGNGFVYRYAPTITTSLTGAASKPYDGNVTASIAGLTLNKVGGEIDGDVINISGLTSATYDNKEVGTGKTVTSNTLTVTSGINGTTTVYGYQVNAATGPVGVITESALSISEAQAAAENPRNTAGLGGLLDGNNQPQQFVSVFDVDATAAGDDIDAEACLSNEDKKDLNPNTSLILNFGVNLPEGVKKTCVE